MASESAEDEAQCARREARRAQLLSWMWWAAVPLVCVTYWFVSKADPPERAMLCILAAVSFIANAVSYATKQKAAEAKAAGYEHP